MAPALLHKRRAGDGVSCFFLHYIDTNQLNEYGRPDVTYVVLVGTHTDEDFVSLKVAKVDQPRLASWAVTNL